MTSPTSILRRRVLTFMLGMAAWGLGRPPGGGAALPRGRGHDPAASRLAQVLGPQESAAIVGREYLKQVPGEANVPLLLGLLCSGWPGQGTELFGTDPQKLRDLVHRQQRQDFEHGRVVNVRGWVLSATEARLCALIALV